MTEVERYLRKARESLASAAADVRAKRYNSAANRSYYAAFQAAVAALIHAGIQRPAATCQHRFVTSQFSGKLIYRWKLISSSLQGYLDRLFRRRVTGDYEPGDVSGDDARRGLRESTAIVEDVERMTKNQMLREASAEYEKQFAEGQMLLDLAEKRIDELKALILGAYPDAKFEIFRLGPKDYRLNAAIDAKSFSRLDKALASRTTDILVDDDLWIVVIPRRPANGD